MKRIINFFRGWIEFTVTGPFPERLFNLCAQMGVAFWSLTRLDEHTLKLRVAAGQRRAFRKAAEQAGCEITHQLRSGIPFLFWRMRKRYAFLAGLCCSLAAVLLLSRFVLTVEVTGNEQVPEQVITAELRRLGVRPGAYGPGLDVRRIAQQALLQLEELSYLTINLHGTRAEVIVRERVEAPEVVDGEKLCDVVADADGVILRMEVLAGDALVQPGDAVLEGESLIAGMVELEAPEYSGIPSTYMSVHAMGNVWARTRRVLTAQIPLETWVKTYTGEETTRFALLLPGRRINFYGNSGISYSEYDKIIMGKSWEDLPVTLVRETARAYTTEACSVETEAAQALLEEQLYARLLDLMSEEGSVVRTAYEAKVENGMLTVTLTAECEEQIGREGPLTNRQGTAQTE